MKASWLPTALEMLPDWPGGGFRNTPAPKVAGPAVIQPSAPACANVVRGDSNESFDTGIEPARAASGASAITTSAVAASLKRDIRSIRIGGSSFAGICGLRWRKVQ